MINTCQRSADGRPKPFCIWISVWVGFCTEARHRGPFVQSIEWGMDSSAEYVIWLADMRTTKSLLLPPPSPPSSLSLARHVDILHTTKWKLNCVVWGSVPNNPACLRSGVFERKATYSLNIFQHSAGGIHVLRQNGIHNKYAVLYGVLPAVFIYIYYVAKESCMPHTSTTLCVWAYVGWAYVQTMARQTGHGDGCPKALWQCGAPGR